MVTVEWNPPHPLEAVFDEFEERTGWQLSSQARAILREGYNAIDTDTLGLGVYAMPQRRADASKKIFDLMPGFLETLRLKAAARNGENESRMIGGVFVLQNTEQWKVLFRCSCWPI